MDRRPDRLRVLGMRAGATVRTASARAASAGSDLVLVMAPGVGQRDARGLVLRADLSRLLHAGPDVRLEEVMRPWSDLLADAEALTAVLVVVAAQDEIPLLGAHGLFEDVATLDDVMAALWLRPDATAREARGQVPSARAGSRAPRAAPRAFFVASRRARDRGSRPVSACLAAIWYLAAGMR